MSSTATIADIARQCRRGHGHGRSGAEQAARRQRRDGAAGDAGGRRARRAAAARPAAQGENFRFAFVLPADEHRRSSSWSTGRSRRRRATSATSTSPRSRTASTPPTPTQFAAGLAQLADCDGVARDGARPAAGQAGDQRAGAHRRARGDAVLRRRRLDARDPRRRRQPRRRAHRRPAARRAWPAAGTRDTLLLSLAGDAAVGARSSAASASRR